MNLRSMFYRPDALLLAQPAASKQRNKYLKTSYEK